MLGSLSFYRRILHENVFSQSSLSLFAFPSPTVGHTPERAADGSLPPLGHAIAGLMAGCTVSFIAAPIEHIKARLQIQYAVSKTARLYSGPIDCCHKIVLPLAPSLPHLLLISPPSFH